MLKIKRRLFLKMLAAGTPAGGVLGSFLLPNSKDILKKVWSSSGDFAVFKHPQSYSTKYDPLTLEAIESNLGHAAMVEISRDKSLVKKTFAVDGVCIGGLPPKYNTQAWMDEFYRNTVMATKKLSAVNRGMVSPIISSNRNERSMVTQYEGKDLLSLISEQGWKPNAGHIEQIRNIYRSFAKAGLEKRDRGLGNICLNKNNRLVVVDLKWTVKRDGLQVSKEELVGIRELARLSPDLPELVLKDLSELGLQIG